jgi:hypothetical protein
MVELEPVPEEDDLRKSCITMAAIWKQGPVDVSSDMTRLR